MKGAGFSLICIDPKLAFWRLALLLLCILGSNESCVYLKVSSYVLCKSVEIKWLVDYVILGVQCRCSECQVKGYII